MKSMTAWQNQSLKVDVYILEVSNERSAKTDVPEICPYLAKEFTPSLRSPLKSRFPVLYRRRWVCSSLRVSRVQTW
jgi:hypothetical protein